MSAKDLILDFSAYDLDHVVADLEAIRRYNPQRHEMEQLTAIVHETTDDPRICVGYKDVTHEEFWARGHMPGMPIMPGVIICEAAAQTCGYYVMKYNLLGAGTMGFGGMDDVRFRDPVLPGSRLVIVAKLLRLRRGVMSVCRFQAFVERSLVCEGQIKGIRLPDDLLPCGGKSSE